MRNNDDDTCELLFHQNWIMTLLLGGREAECNDNVTDFSVYSFQTKYIELEVWS